MSRLSLYGWVLTLIVALITTVANLMLRKGIEYAGGFSFDNLPTLFAGFIKLLCQPVFTLGFVLYFCSALLWFRVIATEPLSIAYPVLVSFTFVLVTYAASVFLQEPITLRATAGILLVALGITLISWR